MKKEIYYRKTIYRIYYRKDWREILSAR